MSRGPLETEVLKGVSRSFYLSLRLLPGPMRKAARVGYLLARTSDTIADSARLPAARRMALLGDFLGWLDGGAAAREWPEDLIEATGDGREQALLRANRAVLQAYLRLEEAERDLVREVVAIIVGGQLLDLERFGAADASNTISLVDAAALEDYTWRVAGCVGVFWTKLGYETMGRDFSEADGFLMCELGEKYGKGLQLVNILRDLPEDLRQGRCYLPVADPEDRGMLMAEFAKWRDLANEWVGCGFAYARQLRSKRLRVASVLPAMIASETLAALENADWAALQSRIKVPRRRVYAMLAKAAMGRYG